MKKRRDNFKSKKSINFKKLMTMDLGDVTSKFLKNIKKFNTLTTPDKKRTVIAFDMGSFMTKIVVGTYYKNDLSIEKYIKMVTPKDVIVDGEIKRSDELAVRLSEVLKENHIKVKDATCTTNSTLIINREILIPKVEKEEIETVVRYEIQQYLPINLDDYVLQMTILDEVEIDGVRKLNIRAIAYPDKIAKKYYKLLTKLELKPYSLDVSYNSVNKFINFTEKNNKYDYNSKDAVAFIDIGASFINVNIYVNEKLDFTRIIKAGGNEIDEILLQNKEFKDENLDKIKSEKIDLNEESESINNDVRELVDDWIEKIEKIIQFYKNKNMGIDVEKIIIFGGTSKLKGMDEYMTTKLGIKTRRVRGISKMAFKSYDDGEPIDDFINAIGSVIRL